MEELTRHQIILVTLLVSFVTSIATGIVTVSLVNQAPQSVTQTINRVVERTIEHVVQPATDATKKPTEVVRETVIVKEDDQAMASIEKASPSLVRVLSQDGTLLGVGAVVSKDGYIASALTSVEVGQSYSVRTKSGIVYGAIVKSLDTERGIGLLKITDLATSTLTAITLGDSSALKLGQNIIALGGKERDEVSLGIISSLSTSPSENATSTRDFTLIDTNILTKETSTYGILLNLEGHVIGFKIYDKKEPLFIPDQYAKDMLKTLTDSAVTKTN